MSDISSLDTSTQQVTLTPASQTRDDDDHTRDHYPLVKSAGRSASPCLHSSPSPKTPPLQTLSETTAAPGGKACAIHDLEQLVHGALNEGRLPDLTRQETYQLKKSTKRRLKKARIQLTARPHPTNSEQQDDSNNSHTVQSLGQLSKAQMKTVNKEAKVQKRKKRLEQRAANRAMKKATRAAQSSAQLEDGNSSSLTEAQAGHRQHEQPLQTLQAASPHTLLPRPQDLSFSGQWSAPFPSTSLSNHQTLPPPTPGFLPQWPWYPASGHSGGPQQGVLTREQQQAATMWSMWHAHQHASPNVSVSPNMHPASFAMPINRAFGWPHAAPFVMPPHGYTPGLTSSPNGLPSQNAQRSFHSQATVAAPYPTRIRTVQTKSKARDRTSRSLEVPVPTREYLDIARRDAKAIDEPRPLLIVLDMNGTLVHRGKVFQNHSITSRPHLAEFVEHLTSSCSVMLWSSARLENVKKMADRIFTAQQRQKLLGEWGREHFDLTSEQFNSKLQVYKHLTWVWKADYLQAKHPWAAQGHQWDATNTVLLDDSVEKACAEPYNLIEISEFTGHATDMDETILSQIMEYLELLKRCDNVAAYMRKTPFKYDNRWQQATFPIATSESIGFSREDNVR